jgi:L-rhamnose-H+ transport protein
MGNAVTAGALLAVLSGIMNGLFTLPMRFLGRWAWENVWTVFIIGACLFLPVAVLVLTVPSSWKLLAHCPVHAVFIALGSGFAWGFGAIMFGQSVSAIGISLANTFVLAVSSALGSLIPMLFLTPEKLHERAGHTILLGIAIEIAGIILCGRAGMIRERTASTHSDRGDLVGKARPLAIALLLVCGSGVLSGVFNIGFALSAPIADFGRQSGLTQFQGNNLIWILMLSGGAVSNLGFCVYLLLTNHTSKKFSQPGAARLYSLGLLMALFWGGSIFVYGAAAPKLGALGASIGWPLSLATGLLVANAVGIGLGEWKHAPRIAHTWMYSGIAILLVAIAVLSRASY